MLLSRTKSLIVVCIGLLLFTSFFNSRAVAQMTYADGLEMLDGYSEQTRDINGNLLELRYEVSHDRVRINSYVNHELVDYSVIRINDGGRMGDEIEYYNLVEGKGIQNQGENPTVYYANQFITKQKDNTIKKYEGENFKSTQDTPSYPFIMSRYSAQFDLTGSLYGTDTIQDEEVFVFDFPVSTALSIIAGVFLTVLGASVTINILALLGGLGIQIVDSVTNTYLAGYYDAQRISWDYEVFVNNVLTLRSYQENLYITYYSTSTQQSYMRIETYGDTRSRNDLIYAGIYNYHILYEVN